MLIKEKISKEKFAETAKDADMLKLVVDIEKEVLSLDCVFHVDCADELLRTGSKGKDLWGANVYPKEKKLDFSAVFNVKPHYNNRSMEVQDAAIRGKVEAVIRKLLPL